MFPIFAFGHETPRVALRQAGAFARAVAKAPSRLAVLVDVARVEGVRLRPLSLSRGLCVAARNSPRPRERLRDEKISSGSIEAEL